MMGRALTILATLSLTAQAAQAAPPKLIVILDPGHGGADTGAIATRDGRPVYEKDITLAIAGATMRRLRALGIPTVLTRGDDRFVTLDRRTKLANEAAARLPNAVFVSIHANSSDESSNSGAELYVLNATTNEASRRLADIENGKAPRTPGRRPAQLTEKSHGTVDLILTDLATTANYAESVGLACSVESTFVKEAGFHGTRPRDRGVRQALFYVLMGTHMPGILFEPGFVSNPAELERLVSPAYQARLASALADGIVRWRIMSARVGSGRVVSALQKRGSRCHIARN